jgi:hypothetical protein
VDLLHDMGYPLNITLGLIPQHFFDKIEHKYRII